MCVARGGRGALMFVLPYLPLLLLFGLIPMGYALKLAFTNDTGHWVGFSNFTKTFDDYRFKPAFKHILVYTTVWLAGLVIFVVGLTLLLHGRASRSLVDLPIPVLHAGRTRGCVVRCCCGCSCSTRR